MKLVFIFDDVETALVILIDSPSQVTILRAWLSTNPFFRTTQPMMMSYRDFGLSNSRKEISGIFLDLQKSGKKIFFRT